MNILGIDTSCDDTSAAIVADGRTVLSNVVNTQIELHHPYGGVVPELASRRLPGPPREPLEFLFHLAREAPEVLDVQTDARLLHAGEDLGQGQLQVVEDRGQTRRVELGLENRPQPERDVRGLAQVIRDVGEGRLSQGDARAPRPGELPARDQVEAEPLPREIHEPVTSP